MTNSTIEQAIREAKAQRFESSTTEDLTEFCGHLKIPVGDTDSQEMLRKKLLSFLGMTDNGGSAVRNRKMTAVARTEIRPPYNLSPSGRWGGRRYLVRLMAPSGSKLAKAEPIGWNGKATYWLPYNELHSVPEPIYNIIKDRKQRVVMQDRIKQADGTEEITTKWEFNGIPFEDRGVDPKTKDLAGSLTEWYQNFAPSWYRERSTRELQTIATILEIPLKHKNGAIETSKSDEELRSDIFLFLFGYADVEDAEKAKA